MLPTELPGFLKREPGQISDPFAHIEAAAVEVGPNTPTGSTFAGTKSPGSRITGAECNTSTRSRRQLPRKTWGLP